MQPPLPRLEPVCTVFVDIGAIAEIGELGGARRRLIRIIGGRVEGPRISGRVIDLGADWQWARPDGVAELDARYAIETADGAAIEVTNHGYRHGPAEVVAALARGEAVDPSRYSMRTAARMTCGDPRYDWVNRTVFVGSGARLADQVVIAFHAVL